MPEHSRDRIFYGYIIVASGFIIMIVIWSAYFSFGVFFKELASEFNLSRAATSGISSATNITYGIFAMVVGSLTDRFGPRAVVMVCGMLAGLGYSLMAVINDAWQIYPLLGLLVGIGTGAAFVPVVSTVTRWFVKRRGITTGIVSAGASIGGLGGPIVASWLIADYGWRTAYVVLGLIVLLACVSCAQFLRRDPRDVGLIAYGTPTVVNGSALEAEAEGVPFRRVILLRQFWLVVAAWFSYGIYSSAITVHLVPHITDLGISAAIAAGVLAALGGIGIFSRLFIGVINDKIGSRRAVIIGLVLMLFSLILILFAREVWLFFSLSLIFGFGFASCGTMLSLLVADLFGKKAHGVTLGFCAAAWGIGSSVGPILVGYLFDITNSYQIGFLLSLLLSAISLAIFIIMKPTPYQLKWPGR